MKLNEFKKWFQDLDKESPEFQQVYEMVVNSYWDMPPEKQDDYVKAGMVLVRMASAEGLENLTIATSKIANEMFPVFLGKSSAVHASIKFENEEIFFDIYKDRNELASLGKMLRNTMVVKHGEKQ